jgi:hypothetical protein
VVADRGLGDSGELAEPRVVPAPEVPERAGLVNVAQIEEAVRVPTADERADAVGPRTGGGDVAGGPDDGSVVRLGGAGGHERGGCREGLDHGST